MFQVTMTVMDVIMAFGGRKKMLRVLGISPEVLYYWECRGIPAIRWQKVSAKSLKHATRHFSLDELAEAEPSRKPKRR